jgi:hypothetical protein
MLARKSDLLLTSGVTPFKEQKWVLPDATADIMTFMKANRTSTNCHGNQSGTTSGVTAEPTTEDMRNLPD